MELSAGEQHEFLASLIDAEELYQNAPCGYLSLSPNGTIIKINRTLLSWLGFDERELIGKMFASLLSRGGQIHFEMFYKPLAVVNKSVKEFSYDILRKDGTLMTVLMNTSAFIGTGDKLLAFNNVLTDNTQRKQYERDIIQARKTAESEKKRLQFMADLVPEIIWTATESGRIDYVNARFCQYFDCDGTETRTTFILAKVHPENQRELMKRWYQCLATGNDLQMDLRLINIKREYEWHLLKAAKFRDNDGNLTNWFGSCANINDHVNALNKKDEFINIASHELKTPITSLKAVMQVLDRLKITPENKMIPVLIEKANRNVNKVHALVEDLLNASQLNDGQLHLNKKVVDMTKLVENWVDEIRIEHKNKIITSGDLNAMVLADEIRIEQVINNFISNAIKYAPDSDQIVVNVKKDSDSVLVEICDNGPGISPEKISHLFERYYQVDNNGSKYSGLGLGLFICSEIIKRHGGQVGAKSTLGAGSIFWFSLPNS
jgi:two-component system CheB/CheR fusion protein